MARTKHIFHDGKGQVWDHPVDAETGKPLTSSVSKRKPTAKSASKPTNPYR